MANPNYNYGIIGFAFGIVGLTGFIRTIFNSAHVKRISEGMDEGKCMGTYISLQTLVLIISLLLVFGGLMFWKHILERGFQSPTHEKVIYLMLIFVSLTQIGSIGVNTFIGKKEIVKTELLRFMDQSVPTIFIIFVAITGGKAIELAYTYITGGLLMALLAVYFLKDLKIKKPSLSSIKNYWEFGLPSFISRSVNTLGNKLDVVLVGLFWSSTNVGLYTAGRRLTLVVNGLAMAVSQVIFPTISEHHSNGDWKSIQNVVKVSTRYLTMLATPVIVFILFFPSEMVHIMLSDAALGAVPVIRILIINAFFVALINPISNVFGGINKPKLGAKISVFANIFNVTLNILLIPDSLFGVPLAGLKEVGAAIATLSATTISFIVKFKISKDIAGTKLPKGIIFHILSALIAGECIYGIHVFILPITRWFHLVSYSIGLLGIYLLILYLVGEFTKQDWHYFMDILNPKEILKDLKKGVK